MAKKSKPILGFVNRQSMHFTNYYFTDDQKHTIINDYLTSGKTKREIWEKYTGRTEEHGQILRWMRKFGYRDTLSAKRLNFVRYTDQMKKKKTSEESGESFENLQLKKRIEELEKQLKDAEMKAIAYSTMVDIAEKEFNISIRKKLSTKPSKK
jgi:hypothetical protein